LFLMLGAIKIFLWHDGWLDKEMYYVYKMTDIYATLRGLRRVKRASH